MLNALKASKIITIVSAAISLVLTILLVFLIVRNKDVLKRKHGAGGAGGEGAYEKMKANPNIDDESEIGLSLVKNALDKKASAVNTDGQKLSTKSLMI